MSESTVIFIEGIAAVGAAVIVFCGSVWLLLMLVLGARLAYFVTATVTLGVLLIMGVVWSVNQLGPVGVLPSWDGVAAADQAAEADFSAAATYPDNPWTPVNRDDAGEAAKASELETEAAHVLEDAIKDGDVTTFSDVGDALVTVEDTRFFEQGGKTYGGVTFEDTEKTASAVVFASYDPGNPLGPARQITGVIFLLFALHLFGLSRIEKRAKPEPAEA
jgi:hypothetical protein